MWNQGAKTTEPAPVPSYDGPTILPGDVVLWRDRGSAWGGSSGTLQAHTVLAVKRVNVVIDVCSWGAKTVKEIAIRKDTIRAIARNDAVIWKADVI